MAVEEEATEAEETAGQPPDAMTAVVDATVTMTVAVATVAMIAMVADAVVDVIATTTVIVTAVTGVTTRHLAVAAGVIRAALVHVETVTVTTVARVLVVMTTMLRGTFLLLGSRPLTKCEGERTV